MPMSRAESLVARAAKSGRAFGVFLVDGQARAASDGTGEYVTYTRRQGALLVGHYDGRALPEQIVDDVRSMRMPK